MMKTEQRAHKYGQPAVGDCVACTDGPHGNFRRGVVIAVLQDDWGTSYAASFYGTSEKATFSSYCGTATVRDDIVSPDNHGGIGWYRIREWSRDTILCEHGVPTDMRDECPDCCAECDREDHAVEPGVADEIRTALVVYDETMAGVEAEEYVDSGDALVLMSHLAGLLRRVVAS